MNDQLFRLNGLRADFMKWADSNEPSTWELDVNKINGHIDGFIITLSGRYHTFGKGGSICTRFFACIPNMQQLNRNNSNSIFLNGIMQH